MCNDFKLLSNRLYKHCIYFSLLLLSVVKPCELRDWELHVHFKVHGSGRDLYGDGFAIWYTKERLMLGMLYELFIQLC
jgi:Legume-like lectin family